MNARPPVGEAAPPAERSRVSELLGVAFALAAEGVQMGTRMVSAAESPVHENFKNAICQAAETARLASFAAS